MMRVSVVRIVLVVLLGISVSELTLQRTMAQRVDAPIGPCLSPEQRAVNEKYYALTRPTSRDDDMPFWDPEYFAGTWEFESRVVDSPLGPGGESVGTMTVHRAGGCRYEGELKAEDPDGKSFTRKITLVYDNVKKHLVWTEVDSRGYTLVKQGPVGGELGGLFHHHFDEPIPVAVGGRRVAIKGVTEMSSPAFFKSDYQYGVDGTAMTTFGRASYAKTSPLPK
jgi:hypothetical protein